jgi:hypothetical protein
MEKHMANSANMSAYADDATTQFTFRPMTREPGLQVYLESSATKSVNALARKTLAVMEQKNKLVRRMKKTELPIMEQASGGNLSGYVAPPKVAHTVTVMTVVLVDPRATATDVANALKLHESAITTDTGAAGTASTYIGLANQVGEVLVQGIMPA